MVMVGEQAHERRGDRAAHDGHDLERSRELCLRTEVAQAHREDKRKHDGHEKPAERQDHPRHLFDVHHDEQEDDRVGDAVEGQQKVRLDDASNQRAGETSNGIQDHGDSDYVGGGGIGPGGAGDVSVPGEERRSDGCARSVFGDGIFQNVVHRKSVHPYLRNDVKELGDDAPGEMGLPEHWGFVIRSVIHRNRFLRVAVNIRQLDEGKDGEHHQYHAAQHDVGRNQRVEIRAPAHLTLAEDERAAQRRGDDVSDRVERLRGGQAACRSVLRTKHCDVRIRSRFDASQTAGEDEQRHQKRPKRLIDQTRWNKQERSDGQHSQAQQDAALVADAADQQSGRQSHKEISAENGGLDEARLGLADIEYVLEMFVQHVQHGMTKSPDEEQRGDHEEREQQLIASWFHGSLLTICLLWSSV